MNRVYRQVTPNRSIVDEAFDKGIIDFNFSIGGKSVFIPSLSYFRIEMELTREDAQIVKANDLAFANLAPCALFDNCYFLAGGQNVSSIVSYPAQASALKYRLGKSGAWLNSVGKDAYGYCTDFTYRRLKTAVTDASDSAIVFPAQDKGGDGKTYFLYQPPIGIMEHDKPMGSGSYRFQFNPSSNYKTACVETQATNKDPGDNADQFQLKIKSMELYICTELMDISPTGSEILNLMELNIQTKPLGGDGEKSFDFTIPSSTKAISIFVQSGNAGTITSCPPTSFKFSDIAKRAGNINGYDSQNSIRSLQITYANITKPPTRWTSQYGGEIKKLGQRYLDTQIESGQAFSEGGCETLQQFIDGGIILHYSWLRDANDRSTQLQLQIDYQYAEAEGRIFLVSHYTRSVEIDIEQGFITDVKTLTI